MKPRGRIFSITSVALLAAACTPPTTPRTELIFRPVVMGPCSRDFIDVTPGNPACGIALEKDGSLALDQRLTSPIIASYQQGADGQVAIPAKRLRLFPPGSMSNDRIVQACDGTGPDSLCWTVRLLKAATAELIPVNAGKYGPDPWIAWSPDDSRLALISRNEGAMWLHIVDTQSGVSTDYPPPTAEENWKIDPASFSWTGDDNRTDSFSVKIRKCESCAPEERSFALSQ